MIIDIKELIAALEAWAPMVSSGYEVPAVGQVMLEAARALSEMLEECGDIYCEAYLQAWEDCEKGEFDTFDELMKGRFNNPLTPHP